MGRTHRNQIEIMVDFMEKNGDLQIISPRADNEVRTDNLKKWNELVELLNTCSEGDPKPLREWRKVWSSLKNSTRRKLESKQRGDTTVTDIDKRVIKVIGFTNKTINVTQMDEREGYHFKKLRRSNSRRVTTTKNVDGLASRDAKQAYEENIINVLRNMSEPQELD